MHDFVIRDRLIADGTGRELFSGDLAIDAGRLTQVGGNVAPGRREIQADGQLVTPGVVDGHTHTTTDRSPGTPCSPRPPRTA